MTAPFSVFLLGAAISLPAAAAGTPRVAGRTARSMSVVFAEARAFAAKGQRVAVVFDIDSTLLGARQDLGSTPWLGEQAAMLKSLDHERFERRFEQALQTWRAIVKATDKMDLLEPQIPAGIAKLQRLGIKTIALTARDPEVLDATLRQVSGAGIDLSPGALAPDSDDIRLPGSDRPAILRSGVLFASGQDKGRLLLALFERASFKPDAVVFVDDIPSNVEHMSKALGDAGLTLAAFHYTRKSPQAARYRDDAKSCIAREQLVLFKATGRVVSNEEVAAKARPCAVPVEKVNRLLYGTADPLKADAP